jgi:hypothetical protein
MKIDKKISIFCGILLFVLSLSLFLLNDKLKFLVAVFLFFYALFLVRYFKKRSVVSVNKKYVLLIVGVSSAIYLMGMYLLGSKYGFDKSLYQFSILNLLLHIIPIVVSIIFYEIIRFTLISQENKMANITTFIAGVILDIILFAVFIIFNFI